MEKLEPGKPGLMHADKANELIVEVQNLRGMQFTPSDFGIELKVSDSNVTLVLPVVDTVVCKKVSPGVYKQYKARFIGVIDELVEDE